MTILSTPIQPAARLRSLTTSAWQDLAGGLLRWELWGRIGWLDVKRRYRRTMLGPFWSSITLGVYTLSVGIVGAGLWNQNINEYLPYLVSGMIVWTLVSTILIEACTLFIAGHALFRNVSFEYSILAYALVWRNFIIFLHNLVVYVLVALALKPGLLSPMVLVALPGVVLVLLNGVWMALLAGLFCLRFRDVQPIIQTAIQILMLTTPIFWIADRLSGFTYFVFVQINPVYRLIDVVRAPLLGQMPTLNSYLAVLAITVVGWCMTYFMFRSFRRRIAYWS
jgi:ABC-type polysaccharide/polyol phosphate export permease